VLLGLRDRARSADSDYEADGASEAGRVSDLESEFENDDTCRTPLPWWGQKGREIGRVTWTIYVSCLILMWGMKGLDALVDADLKEWFLHDAIVLSAPFVVIFLASGVVAVFGGALWLIGEGVSGFCEKKQANTTTPTPERG